MKRITMILLVASVAAISSCKKKGCTDVNASNYSSEAEKDDNSCEYNFFIKSEAVDENGELLAAYKCESNVSGIEASIPLEWGNVPDGTGSLAIIMQHFPNSSDTINANSYLILWGISPSVLTIAHGAADDGPWYMGSNKDGDYISYTSPCSPDPGTHAYEIVIYALSQTPTTLPTQSSLSVDRTTFLDAISTVTVVGKAIFEFNDVN